MPLHNLNPERQQEPKALYGSGTSGPNMESVAFFTSNLEEGWQVEYCGGSVASENRSFLSTL